MHIWRATRIKFLPGWVCASASSTITPPIAGDRHMIPYLAKELRFCAIHDKHIYLKLQIIQWLNYSTHKIWNPGWLSILLWCLLHASAKVYPHLRVYMISAWTIFLNLYSVRTMIKGKGCTWERVREVSVRELRLLGVLIQQIADCIMSESWPYELCENIK